MKRVLRPTIPEIGRLLALYRFWGSAAVASFAVFISLLIAAWRSQTASYLLSAMSLFAGFIWIGATSISRHTLIRLKNAIGEQVGIFEFLSTQFIFILFPFSYRKVRKETERYAEKG